MVTDLIDTAQLIAEAVIELGEPLKEMAQALMQMIEQPEILLLLLEDQITEFQEADFNGRMQMLGKFVGGFVVGGAGITKIAKYVKNSSKLADLANTLKNADTLSDMSRGLREASDLLRDVARRRFLGDRLVPVSVGGVPLNVQFLDDGTTNLRYLSEATDGLSPGDVRKVVDELEDLTPLQRAYAKITNANGDVSKLVRYTERDGMIVWLEEGNQTSGWKHIDEVIRDSGVTRTQELINAGLAKNSQDVERLIFEIIETGTPSAASPSGTIYRKNINNKTPYVLVGENGYIVTIAPN